VTAPSGSAVPGRLPTRRSGCSTTGPTQVWLHQHRAAEKLIAESFGAATAFAAAVVGLSAVGKAAGFVTSGMKAFGGAIGDVGALRAKRRRGFRRFPAPWGPSLAYSQGPSASLARWVLVY
jgi:hypothetical protein